MIFVSQLLSVRQQPRVHIDSPNDNQTRDDKEKYQVPDKEIQAVDPPEVLFEREPGDDLQSAPDETEHPAQAQDDCELFEQLELVFLFVELQSEDCFAEPGKNVEEDDCVEDDQRDAQDHQVDQPWVGGQLERDLVDQVEDEVKHS